MLLEIGSYLFKRTWDLFENSPANIADKLPTIIMSYGKHLSLTCYKIDSKELARQSMRLRQSLGSSLAFPVTIASLPYKEHFVVKHSQPIANQLGPYKRH